MFDGVCESKIAASVGQGVKHLSQSACTEALSMQHRKKKHACLMVLVKVNPQQVLAKASSISARVCALKP
eukprot:1162136-Pelagomonas_calceolata.AAC.11